MNPAISAYAQVNGNFNFSDTPLAPAGCKIVIHDGSNERASWALHGTNGFYIGPVNKHYHNYQCYIPATKSIRVSNTVEIFPHHPPLSTVIH